MLSVLHMVVLTQSAGTWVCCPKRDVGPHVVCVKCVITDSPRLRVTLTVTLHLVLCCCCCCCCHGCCWPSAAGSGCRGNQISHIRLQVLCGLRLQPTTHNTTTKVSHLCRHSSRYWTPTR